MTDEANRGLDRTIVFDVSGVIENLTPLRLSNADGEPTFTGGITLNGFTAPRGGITIIGHMIRFVEGPQVIVRGLRFRCGYETESALYSRSSILFGDSAGVIVDRCSIGFNEEQSTGGNGGDARAPNSGITFQNNLIGNGRRGAITGSNTNDGVPARVTWTRNVLVDCGWRTPNVAGNIRMDLVNNFVHNWRNRLSSFTTSNTSETTQTNLIGNYFQAGDDSRNSGMDVLFKINDNNDDPQFHFRDNFISADVAPENYPAEPAGAFTNYPDGSSQTIQPSWFRYPEFPFLGEPLDVLSSDDLKDELFETVGACQYTDDSGDIQFYRDPIDEDMIERADTNAGGLQVHDYRNRANALRTLLPEETRPAGFYNPAKSEHIPETWYDAHMPPGATHNDLAPSGFTWMEEYINQVDGGTEPVEPIEPTDAGVSSDAGGTLDAGGVASDVGAAPDAPGSADANTSDAGEEAVSDQGCGCTSAQTSPPRGGLLFCAFLFALLARRRRIH